MNNFEFTKTAEVFIKEAVTKQLAQAPYKPMSQSSGTNAFNAINKRTKSTDK